MSHHKNTWSRHPRKGKTNYELSSKGDKRYSPLFAKLPDGRTIEEAYQLDIKGYRHLYDDWKLVKGKQPLSGLTEEQLYDQFKLLLKEFLTSNGELFHDLINISKKYENFTDMFASGYVSQARAYCEIINELRNK